MINKLKMDLFFLFIKEINKKIIGLDYTTVYLYYIFIL